MPLPMVPAPITAICSMLMCQAPSDALEDHGDALATADAHGGQGVAALDALQLMDGLGGDDRAGGAHRVTQGNARTVGVDLFRVEAQFASHGAGLGGEGFVGL